MNWRDAFAEQATTCESLGSPFTARLLRLILRDGLPEERLRRRIESWPGDMTARGAAVALRLAGALHGLALEGREAPLATIYPPRSAPSDDALAAAVASALFRHADWIDRRLDLPPQTNEVGRSAFLIAAAHLLADRTRLPIVLTELGASAGLNLLFDRYALVTPGGRRGPADARLTLTPHWRGLAPPASEIFIVAREGVDLAPLDPVSDRLRLLSYVWPDQAERLEHMQAALSEAGRVRPKVVGADAIDYLAARLTEPFPGALHMVFHTVAWQYFPVARQEAGTRLLASAGAKATVRAPLALVTMEADGQGEGADLSVTLWPDGVRQAVGRCDFHGRWLDWRPSPG